MSLASLSGVEIACNLGGSWAEIQAAGYSSTPTSPIFPSLAQHPGGQLADFGAYAGAWIANRQPLRQRRYGIATNAALLVTSNLVARLAWTPEELREAWIFGATSRGNISEFQGKERRAFSQLAASNTLASEIAAAVSIQHGIRGPWQLISNGCASSLDALGLAGLAVSSGLAPRALVVTAEMPLCPPVLQAFKASGVLSTSNSMDVYSPQSRGFLLGEGAAAVALEPTRAGLKGPQLLAYQAGSDAWDAMGLAPAAHSVLPELLAKISQKTGRPHQISPHATGTQECRSLELEILSHPDLRDVPLSLWKSRAGHTLGASGLLELALATQGLTQPGIHWKWASSMGGHHAVVAVGGGDPRHPRKSSQ